MFQNPSTNFLTAEWPFPNNYFESGSRSPSIDEDLEIDTLLANFNLVNPVNCNSKESSPQSSFLNFGRLSDAASDQQDGLGTEMQNDLKNLYNIQHEFNGYCETVRVESTSVVAQIVGKGGVKIKHLIQKYGCHIQSPSPGEEPVFVITGCKERVQQIKRELVMAAAHFTSIATQRQDRIKAIMSDTNTTGVTLHLPEKYVGLVVGRFGRTVREMQKKYNVYIDTPRTRNSSFFTIYGQQNNILAVLDNIHKSLCYKTKMSFIIRHDQDVHIEPAASPIFDLPAIEV